VKVSNLRTRFSWTPLEIPGVQLVQRKRIGDARGGLSRLFCADELAKAGWHWPIMQINQTHTLCSGTVRGMHYQHPPHAEAKMVTCLRGRVWDVALDLRAGSPTFLRWCARELNAQELTSILIPPGFAHGFQTLTDDVEMLYFHSAVYSQEAEAGLRVTDAHLDIRWPLPIVELSVRDASHALIDHTFSGLIVNAVVAV
jgi:dTDP-4-dehydrorhamnose 3,5-epimerase